MNRHIILTNGRSGSNNVANTLNLHPQIVNYGEVLGPWTLPRRLYDLFRKVTRSSLRDYLGSVYGCLSLFYAAQVYSALAHVRKGKKINFKRRGDVRSVGIKDFFAQFQRNPEALEFLVENPDIAIVRLYRENLLHRYVSLVSMKATKLVATEKAARSAIKIRVDVDDMLAHLEGMNRQRDEELRILARLEGRRLLTLKYEHYFATGKSMLEHDRRIFEFLGVPPLDTRSRHRKILPKNLAEVVENYDEVRRRVAHTKYEEYLD